MTMLKLHQNELVTASPVWHELQYGCHRLKISKKRRTIETFLEEVVWRHIPILPYDQKSALWHAKQRARLSKKGVVPPFVDGPIAGIAAVNGATLVTRNLTDFKIFADIKVLSWHQ